MILNIASSFIAFVSAVSVFRVFLENFNLASCHDAIPYSAFDSCSKNLDTCYISVTLNCNQKITRVNPLVFCDETSVN